MPASYRVEKVCERNLPNADLLLRQVPAVDRPSAAPQLRARHSFVRIWIRYIDFDQKPPLVRELRENPPWPNALSYVCAVGTEHSTGTAICVEPLNSN